MFPFIFLAAFNIVLSYLFGKGIIAVDMWLNLTTSSPSEMGEMLSQIYPSVVAVVLIYIPTLIYATYDICKKNKLPQNFLKKQRVIALTILVFACPCSIIAIQTRNWSILNDLFPINVSYNFYLAIERQKLSENYLENSKEFCFNAIDTSNDSIPKVLMLVIGETSRTANWQLNGYKRETNPLLSRTENLIFFKDCMSQSNTTHKSIPIILSPATADKFDVLYHSKGLLAAYNEAKYHTVFISNQPRNKSFNDYLGEQAQEVTFLRDSLSGTQWILS
jgi:glucan phosphoethanolaminetransferase (alkaline phosphatase superfamily)